MRELLINTLYDYTNNYLTVSKYAEHNGLTEAQAESLLVLASQIASTPHPEE